LRSLRWSHHGEGIRHFFGESAEFALIHYERLGPMPILK
jgi:hypothetical protein